MKKTISELNIYLVGGAVRDFIMEIPATDRDYVVVGSTPEEMLSLGFTQVGADFPVFLHPETKEEYALARCERKSGPGYLGFTCEFGPEVTLEADLGRRDFTCNSIALNLDTGAIIDPFGGQDDILLGILKITSDAFAEDPLRVLRAARFCAKYNWKMSESDEQICKNVIASGVLNELPTERFWKEIEKVHITGTIGNFLYILSSWGVYEQKVNFFCDALPRGSLVYGNLHLSLDNYDWISALFSIYIQPTSIFPNKMAARLYQANAAYRNMDYSIDCIYDFLVTCSAFNNNSIIDEFMKFKSHINTQTDKYLKTIQISYKLCQTVTAADFPHLSGKDTGDAMKNKRKQLISCLFVS